ncbi:MAG: hypothetical protein ABIY50_00575 [Ignavibacteria bacterium]
MKKSFSVLLVALLFLVSNYSFSQNVNVTPAPATYPTLGAAFTAINAGTHGAAAVTVTIVGNTVEPAVASLNGGVFASCLITPAGVRTVSGNFNTAVIRLNGADNVTIDGIGTGGNSLEVINPNAGTSANGVECINGATMNIIRTITCTGLGASGGTAGGRGINIGQSAALTGGNNNNLLVGCTTNGFRRGIQNFGTATATGFTNDNTTIRNCNCKNATSLAIFIGSEVSNNTIEGCQVFMDAPTPTDVNFRAINIQGVGTTNVRNNRIFSLKSSTASASFLGILTIPITLTAPGSNVSSVNLNNNMISIADNNVGAGSIYGILMTSNPSVTPYTGEAFYNSILISGVDAPTTAGFSVGIDVDNDVAGSNMKAFNNLVLNSRTGGDSTEQHIGGLIVTAPGVTVSADYNVFRATDAVHGFNAGWDAFLYNNINQYREAASNPNINELHTVFNTTFSFVSATDLHLIPSSLGGSINGTPIAGINTDIDGNTRSTSTPYRGADELAVAFNTLNVSVALEGALPPNTDIVTMALAGSASPHSLVALATETISGGSHTGTYYFGGVISNGTPYYLVAIHRNHIQTWSAVTITFVGGVASYSYTTSLAQAFGANQIIYSGLAAMYGGDVNQDGIVDGTDGAAIDNDASVFRSGNQLLTDVTDDGVVDGSDGAIADNNASNFISVVAPPSPYAISSDPMQDNLLKNQMSVFNKRTTNSNIGF